MEFLKNYGKNLKDKMNMLTGLGDPLTLLSEAGPMINQMYQPEVAKFLNEIQSNNLKENEHHIALHVVAINTTVKIYIVAVDADGNTTRKLSELPFDLIFGFGILKKQLAEEKPKQENQQQETIVKQLPVEPISGNE